MTPADPKLLEHLCAWMDGELPPDQARFLERRLAHEPALREQFERWQLASAAMRGQPVRLMPAGFCAAVAAELEHQPAPKASRRWPLAAGIAAAAMALALLPGLVEQGTAPGLPPAPEVVRQPAPALPVVPAPEDARRSPVPRAGLDALALEDAGTPPARPWPRSPLGQDDRAMEAYLVRHNAMMAADGLGGFMPYVDVVAHAEQGAPVADRDDEGRR